MLQSTPRSKVHCLLLTFNPLSLQLLTGASLRALFHLFSVILSAALLITTTAFTSSVHASLMADLSLIVIFRFLPLSQEWHLILKSLREFQKTHSTQNTSLPTWCNTALAVSTGAPAHFKTFCSWEEDHSDELCLKVAKAAYFIQRMNRRARELCKATSEQINSDMCHQDEIKKLLPASRKENKP